MVYAWATVEHETEKALLLNGLYGQTWMPKSQVRLLTLRQQPAVEMPKWLYRKNSSIFGSRWQVMFDVDLTPDDKIL